MNQQGAFRFPVWEEYLASTWCMEHRQPPLTPPPPAVEQSVFERQRMTRDLHDGVCQELAGAALLARALEQRLQRQDKAEAAEVGQLAGYIEHAAEQVRRVIDKHPPQGELAVDLVKALENYLELVRRAFGINCILHAPNTLPPLPASLINELCFIVQEAVTNAARHARACRIVTELRVVGNRFLKVRVHDNGRGLPDHFATGRQMGTRFMKERTLALQGRFLLRPARRGGTEVLAIIPFK